MITAEQLVKAGYKAYPSYCNQATRLYQKTIYSDDGSSKLYFINLYLYNIPPKMEDSWSGEVALYDTNGEDMRLMLIIDESHTVDRVEKFYSEAYKRLGCMPDKHNN